MKQHWLCVPCTGRCWQEADWEGTSLCRWVCCPCAGTHTGNRVHLAASSCLCPQRRAGPGEAENEPEGALSDWGTRDTGCCQLRLENELQDFQMNGCLWGKWSICNNTLGKLQWSYLEASTRVTCTTIWNKVFPWLVCMQTCMFCRKYSFKTSEERKRIFFLVQVCFFFFISPTFIMKFSKSTEKMREVFHEHLYAFQLD